MHEASSAKLAKVAELTDKLTELVKAKANEVRDRDTPFGLAVWLVGPAMYFFMEPGHAEVLCDDGVKHRLREEVLSQIPGDVRKTLLDRFLLTPKDSGWVFAPGAARGHRKPKKRRRPETLRKVLQWAMIETVCEYYNLSPTRNREPGRRGQHTGSGCDVLRQALAHFGVHKAYSTIESDHRWVKQNRLQDLLHPQHMQALHELADRRFDVEAFELCCLKLIGRHG